MNTPGNYPNSYYANGIPQFALRQALQGELTVDVCIVGAGYTGLSSALHLPKP